MKKIRPFISRIKEHEGAAAVLVAIVLFVLVGCVALAVDVALLLVARGEVQNASDAGALGGARFLYNDDGTAVNAGANQIAYDTARENTSVKLPVDLNWTSGNAGDVQRGHWSFATRTFTPNDSLLPVDLWNRSADELDADPEFINAVRVVSRREATPVPAFFARIFGHEDFQVAAEAVAYIGFAGTLAPWEADQPIVICEDSIVDASDQYSCNIGRMINSGQNVASSETGGWTSFNQDNPCTGGTNAQEVKGLVCGDGNPQPLILGNNMATNGGEIQSAFNKLIQCWESTTDKRRIWNLTLPVVECPSNNIGTCESLVGAVNVNVVWITGAGEDPTYSEAPTEMYDEDGAALLWSNGSEDGQTRWEDFRQHFNLRNVDESPAPYNKKSIYFLPDCTPHEPAGVTGGKNFGILAKVPVLVQ